MANSSRILVTGASGLICSAVVRGEPIVMKSVRKSLCSYIHCDDCASAIMTVVEKGMPGEAR